MPQIAQQDYLRIKPVNGLTVVTDAAALEQMRKAVESGTIWDCIVENLTGGEDESNYGKVIGYISPNEFGLATVSVFDPQNDEVQVVSLYYSTTQYEGLAAIQAGLRAGGYDISEVPILSVDVGLLREGDGGTLVSVDGHSLIPNVDSARIVSLSIGEKINPAEESFTNITWEDAQKLIGLPIVQ